jgi:hypothetical protein
MLSLVMGMGREKWLFIDYYKTARWNQTRLAASERLTNKPCIRSASRIATIPLTEMIAKKIIKIAQTGIQDPAQLSALAMKELEIR